MANSERMISASKLVTRLAKRFRNRGMVQYDDLMAEIADVPTVDAVEVVHGHWTTLYKVDVWMGISTIDCFICSECGVSSKRKGNYCPNCGAKMDGGNEDG